VQERVFSGLEMRECRRGFANFYWIKFILHNVWPRERTVGLVATEMGRARSV
jgi:hypothetical protein